jgi:hypothetical protein
MGLKKVDCLCICGGQTGCNVTCAYVGPTHADELQLCVSNSDVAHSCIKTDRRRHSSKAPQTSIDIGPKKTTEVDHVTQNYPSS